jgi:hypothetical protein
MEPVRKQQMHTVGHKLLVVAISRYLIAVSVPEFDASLPEWVGT